MNIFGKNIIIARPSEDIEKILFGIEIYKHECECCGDVSILTRIGIGFAEIGIIVTNATTEG